MLAATVLASHYGSSQARFADLTAPGEVALVRLPWGRTGSGGQVPVERRAGAGLLQVFRRAGRVPQGRPASASGAVTAAALVANPPRRTRRRRQVGAEVPRPVTADMSAMVAPQLMSQVSDAQAPPMTLITKRDIQATRSHHSRHTERRFCVARGRAGSTASRAQCARLWACASGVRKAFRCDPVSGW